MAKKQTRRSISVSRTTYERLKAFCETNNISMSQLVETRVNDFLGDVPGLVGAERALHSGAMTMPGPGVGMPRPVPPRPTASPARFVDPRAPNHPVPASAGSHAGHAGHPGSGGSGASSAGPATPVPMTSAAARFA